MDETADCENLRAAIVQLEIYTREIERLKSKFKMSCRIDRAVEEEDRLILRVSGRIEAENVGTFRQLLGREKGGVVIDLREVILVDREVVSFLAVSESNGIELRNCPAYIREWVDREKVRIDTGHQA